MGFLDFPAPLFSAVDGIIGMLPDYPRLIVWAVITAILSMFLYWLCSAQGKVGEAKERAIAARKAMAAYDGHEFGEMWPLARESLGASLKHFGIVLGPALLSSVPALMLIVWVSNEFGYTLPEPGTEVAMQSYPADSLSAQSVTWPAAGNPVTVTDVEGNALVELPLAGTIPVVHKRVWWNSLIANPNGYLDESASVDEVSFELQSQSFLSFGPGWIRGWEFSYFVVLILCSLGIKVAFRIH